MNKKNIECILFVMFKIKIVSHSNCFLSKKNEISLVLNNIHN